MFGLDGALVVEIHKIILIWWARRQNGGQR